MRWRLRSALREAGGELMEGPLHVIFKFVLPIPKSWSQNKKDHPPEHVSKPDLDNLIKMWDIANGILFHDDSQICKIEAEKMYGRVPRTEVTCQKFKPGSGSENGRL